MTDQTTTEAHRLALSEALGLGTGAPWDAIRDRAAELNVELETARKVEQSDTERLTHLEGENARLRQAASPAPLPVSEARTRLLQALDAPYCQALGHTPEGLLAAYEASRTQTVDDSTVEALSDTLYDALYAITPFAEKYFADEGEGLRAAVRAVLEQVVVLPATTNHDTDTSVTPPPALTEEGRLRARVQVLEEDAERDQGLAATGARCLLRGHQGQIESGRAVIEGHRFALSTKLGLGTGAPWDAIHERVAELRRVADETAATEGARQAETATPPCIECGHPRADHGEGEDPVTPGQCQACPDDDAWHDYQPAAGTRQDGTQR
ncbi:hypothetical protein GCM10010348_79210 [Streptomyces anthocyanicus]|uniref:hypothetical protein n=1 Tax=Streptomyces anthocyanicus TaxID=68174 RepID=UPI001874245C|nr:hypothetical protein [Streptomyces anthocyanicus]GHC40121.1 hypothetical protein GCM10010348_79210 [Streptomyces anthocyanicus]